MFVARVARKEVRIVCVVLYHCHMFSIRFYIPVCEATTSASLLCSLCVLEFAMESVKSAAMVYGMPD